MKLPATIFELSNTLGVAEKDLLDLCNNIKKNIRLSKIPKPNGEYRVITEPSIILKKVLDGLYKKILKPIKPHRLFFLKPTSSYLMMINQFTDYPIIMTADIDDFYPSVKPHQVRKQLCSLGFNDELSKFITRLTTVKFSLPQGFPTSPAIAAIVLHPVLKRLEGLERSQDFKVGLYADNLAIGADFNLHKFKNLIIKIFNQNGFVIEKFKFMSVNDCREIMKIVILENNKLSVKKTYRDDLRHQIFLLKKNWNLMTKHERGKRIASINGRLIYIKQVNAKEVENLLNYIKKLSLPCKNSRIYNIVNT